MRRPLLVGALVAAVTALVASAAIAVGTLGGPSFGPSTRGDDQGPFAGMMRDQGQNLGQGPYADMMDGTRGGPRSYAGMMDCPGEGGVLHP